MQICPDSIDAGFGFGPSQPSANSALDIASQGIDELPLRFLSTGGQVLSVNAKLEGNRATDLWLAGQGRIVARGIWMGGSEISDRTTEAGGCGPLPDFDALARNEELHGPAAGNAGIR